MSMYLFPADGTPPHVYVWSANDYPTVSILITEYNTGDTIDGTDSIVMFADILHPSVASTASLPLNPHYAVGRVRGPISVYAFSRSGRTLTRRNITHVFTIEHVICALAQHALTNMWNRPGQAPQPWVIGSDSLWQQSQDIVPDLLATPGASLNALGASTKTSSCEVL